MVAACCSIRSPYSLLRWASAAVRSCNCAIRLGAGDRDHRLLGEGLQQFDLAIGEWSRRRTADGNRAQWHTMRATSAPHHRPMAEHIYKTMAWIGGDIFDLINPSVQNLRGPSRSLVPPAGETGAGQHTRHRAHSPRPDASSFRRTWRPRRRHVALLRRLSRNQIEHRLCIPR